MDTIQVFLSYSHEEQAFKNELDTHLSLLKREKKLVTWYDGLIEAGLDTEKEICHHINSAEIILFLLSANFFASKFCHNQLETAQQRYDKDSIRVIPVLARYLEDGWENLPCGKLSYLPSDGNPIESYNVPSKAYADIATNIRRVVNSLLEKRVKTDTEKNSSDIQQTLEIAENDIDNEKNPKYLCPKPSKLVQQLFGRDDDLSDLSKELDQENMIAVLAEAGVGKSEMVKEFVYRNEDRFDHIAWIDVLGSFKEGLNQALQHRFPTILDQNHLYRAILGDLGSLNTGNNLLILDNVSKALDENELYILEQLNWKVLMTSRRTIPGVKNFNLGVLKPKASIDLFYSFYKQKQDDESVMKLVNLAGHHPLSIELLAKNANGQDLSLKDFSLLIEQKGFNIINPQGRGV